jgi:hypothetical protein
LTEFYIYTIYDHKNRILFTITTTHVQLLTNQTRNFFLDEKKKEKRTETSIR